MPYKPKSYATANSKEIGLLNLTSIVDGHCNVSSGNARKDLFLIRSRIDKLQKEIEVKASSDRTRKIWDLASGKELRTLSGHTSGVNVVAITPDGRQAISASDDMTLKIWDLKSGSLIATFYGDSSILSCTIKPKGLVFIAGEATGRIHNSDY